MVPALYNWQGGAGAVSIGGDFNVNGNSRFVCSTTASVTINIDWRF